MTMRFLEIDCSRLSTQNTMLRKLEERFLIRTLQS